ncbi:MAG: hypothetical protein GX458_09370 [Phyllobacteriaceae bacterium]|nr:hypothetical protein [Phyllobacteriaceae bacterium]
MIDNFSLYFEYITSLLNQNQGVLDLAIFFVSIIIGWISGIFSSLIKRPKLKIDLIDGPTFVCTFGTGKIFNGMKEHRTAVALYLRIINAGSAPTDILNISIGYHWHISILAPVLWFKYRIFWFYLTNQTISIEDFQSKIGENIKIYPYLVQRSILENNKVDTYILPGMAINGIVYFEQSASFGGCFPSRRSGYCKVRIRITDSYGRRHSRTAFIPSVSLEQARTFNPSFGKTLSELHGDHTPVEIEVDSSGNVKK